MKIRAKAYWHSLRNRLTNSRSLAEAEVESYWLMEHFLELSRTDIILDQALPEEIPQSLTNAIERLEDQEPIQYILGQAWFYGQPFSVAPGVLIPRPETEELIQLVLERMNAHEAEVMDVGTGSGCIPITLATQRPSWRVHGLDISQDALAIAQQNAENLGAKVHWHQANILNENLPDTVYDLIISNPPYVRRLEGAEMERKVLDHEPHLALFVPNDDPLIFYRRLVILAKQHLRSGGILALEINEAFGEETIALCHKQGFIANSLYQDMQGKDRMVLAYNN